jgi:hypothetical protein
MAFLPCLYAARRANLGLRLRMAAGKQPHYA